MPSNRTFIIKTDEHAPVTACWVKPSDVNRLAAEHFICERYWLSFNACITQLPEHILAVYQNDRMVAACGIQLAETRALFSEQYMTQSLGTCRVLGQLAPAREQIAEVGSMATLGRRYLPFLVDAIVLALRDIHRALVLFTATRGLAHFLERRGIELEKLATAAREKLKSDNRADWGSYYAHQPSVFAGWTDSYSRSTGELAHLSHTAFWEQAHA
tara:strand:+ start:1847 stop:2491 length:645 start_codon:yes stop_codon:yes gene_type:complete